MPSKTLIVYYSRTGTAERLARRMAGELGCEARKIEFEDGKKISAPAAIMHSFQKATPNIRGDQADISDYDKIVYITPVWASGIGSPIRSHMVKYRDVTREYELHVVFMGRDFDGAVKDAETAMGKPAALAVPHLKNDIV